MKVKTEPYIQALKSWPEEGEVILAQYDDQSIIVYQAYNSNIAAYALKHQKFLGCPAFSTDRMSWIKTNFLWMQYRSGWCLKDRNQERCLAIQLRLPFFRALLGKAVPSRCSGEAIGKKIDADVRVQWDPDHFPDGTKCRRRAIQLGLRGPELMRMASGEAVVWIEDITELVTGQSDLALDPTSWHELIVPVERPFVP